MVYSFVGLGKPLAAVNNMLKSYVKNYRKKYSGESELLTPGGIFASDISMAAVFAADNDMCAYISMEELVAKSDIIFVFLSDKALKNFSITLGKIAAKGKIFCHFSPAFGSSVLDYNSVNSYFSVYIPYFTKDDMGASLPGHIIAEGYGKQADNFNILLSGLGVSASFVSAQEKLMCITAASLVKDMPLVLKRSAQRLFKFALASDKEAASKLMDLAFDDSSSLSSYNPTDYGDADFAHLQCQNLKSLGIDEITNLYSVLLGISSRIGEVSAGNDKIYDIARKTMEQK